MCVCFSASTQFFFFINLVLKGLRFSFFCHRSRWTVGHWTDKCDPIKTATHTHTRSTQYTPHIWVLLFNIVIAASLRRYFILNFSFVIHFSQIWPWDFVPFVRIRETWNSSFFFFSSFFFHFFFSFYWLLLK